MNFVKFVKLSCETYVTFTATVIPGGSVRVRAKLTVEFTQTKIVVCNVSGQPIGPIVKDKAVQDSTLEDRTDRSFRNVDNKLTFYAA
jgi:hypothetical protein